MLLIGVKENDGWIMSRWNLTYGTGWEGILKACNSVMKYYDKLEILVDNNIVNAKSEEEIMKLDESRSLTFRGLSKIIKVPLMITFYNQLQAVDVSVAMIGEEFSTVDYEKFNKSLGQYMDSIELAMNR